MLHILLAGLLLTLALGAAGCSPRTKTMIPIASASSSEAATSSAAPTDTMPSTDDTPAEAAQVPTTFAIIGDFGTQDTHEQAVAGLVASWSPSFVIALGDNYVVPDLTVKRDINGYDESVGAYYGDWLKDITTKGRRCPVGRATVNAFFPALGNHDLDDAGLDAYLSYFTLPGTGFNNTSGNERYYDFVEGPIHFFVLDSNPRRSGKPRADSRQARWLQSQLAASTSSWNIVYDHHPPYSSDDYHESTGYMQWPFAAWGADAVLSGHAHTYERIMRDGIVYFVNGLGGQGRYGFTTPVDGSAVRYNSNFGAQRVTATDTSLEFEFFDVNGTLVDSYRLVF